MRAFFSNMKSGMTRNRWFLLLFVAIFGAAFAYSIYGTPAVKSSNSSVNATPMGQTTIQGGNDITPAYKAALETADTQRIEAAKDSGKSAVPTIQSNTQDQELPLLPIDTGANKTPTVAQQEAAVVQQPVVTQQPIAETVPIVTAPPPAATVISPEKINSLTAAMNFARRPLPVAEIVQFNPTPKAADTSEQSSPSVSSSAAAAAASKIKVPLAGTILYAELIGRANSDHPGPVIARVLQGEYTGSTLIGSFSNVQNALVITFDRIAVKKTLSGEDINEAAPIKATAVDTKYIGSGLATSVDRHLFQKLAISFTTGFAKGFGQAVSQTGSTSIDTANGTVTQSSNALNTRQELLSAGGQAVGDAGTILQQEFGSQPTTVIVEAGTPIGVLFL